MPSEFSSKYLPDTVLKPIFSFNTYNNLARCTLYPYSQIRKLRLRQLNSKSDYFPANYGARI